jgi:hypothetical protein
VVQNQKTRGAKYKRYKYISGKIKIAGGAPAPPHTAPPLAHMNILRSLIKSKVEHYIYFFVGRAYLIVFFEELILNFILILVISSHLRHIYMIHTFYSNFKKVFIQANIIAYSLAKTTISISSRLVYDSVPLIFFVV